MINFEIKNVVGAIVLIVGLLFLYLTVTSYFANSVDDETVITGSYLLGIFGSILISIAGFIYMHFSQKIFKNGIPHRDILFVLLLTVGLALIILPPKTILY